MLGYGRSAAVSWIVRRTAPTNASAGPLVRTRRAVTGDFVTESACASGMKYWIAPPSSVTWLSRASSTTPTTAVHGALGLMIFKHLPSGFCPGQKRRAIVSFTTATHGGPHRPEVVGRHRFEVRSPARRSGQRVQARYEERYGERPTEGMPDGQARSTHAGQPLDAFPHILVQGVGRSAFVTQPL